MKYIFEWVIKTLLTISIIAVILWGCILMSLIMWDTRYIELGEKAKKYLWE